MKKVYMMILLMVYAISLLVIPYFNGARNPLSWGIDAILSIAFLIIVYIAYKPGAMRMEP